MTKSSRTKAVNANTPVGDFTANSLLALGILASKSIQERSAVSVAYSLMLKYTIDALDLPPVGSLVAVNVENPHINLIQNTGFNLYGSNVVLNHAGHFERIETIEQQRELYKTSEADFNDPERNSLILTVHGRVVDYTIGYKRRYSDYSDSDSDKPDILVHLDLNPFTEPNDFSVGEVVAVNIGVCENSDSYHPIIQRIGLDRVVDIFRR